MLIKNTTSFDHAHIGNSNIIPTDSYNIVGSMITSSARSNVYSTGEWTSSGPWTTYYNSWQDVNSITQGWNMLMGDGYPDGTTQFKYVGDSNSSVNRLVQYATQNRIGYIYQDKYEFDNIATNYAGITLHVMPIRNNTKSSITRTLSRIISCKDSNYGGSSVYQYNPNSTLYSNTTYGIWSQLATYGGDNQAFNQAFKVTVPSHTTILIVCTSCWNYLTTSRFKDSNMFHGLNYFFLTDNSLVCDLRMLNTLASGRVLGETYTTANPSKWYKLCAEMYGDR